MTSSFVQHGCTLRGGITTIAGFVPRTCTVQTGTGMLEIIAEQRHLHLERPSEPAVVPSRIAFFARRDILHCYISKGLDNLSFM